MNLCYSLKSYLTLVKRLDEAEFKYCHCINNNKTQYITGFCSKKVEDLENIKQEMINSRRELDNFTYSSLPYFLVNIILDLPFLFL